MSLNRLKCIIVCCFCLLSSIIIRAQMPTMRQIYNFDIGDVFHFSTSGYELNSYYGGASQQIMGKKVSLLNDTFVYYTRENSYTIYTNPTNGSTDTFYNTKYDTLVYTLLDSLVNSQNELHDKYLSWYKSFEISNPLCLAELTFYDTLNPAPVADTTFTIYATELRIPNCGTSNARREDGFVLCPGLGVIYYWETYSGGLSYGRSRGLTYFKKGNITSGKPDILLSVKNENGKPVVKLFPNPAQDILYLQLNSECIGKTFHVYDSYGRIQLSGAFTDITQEIHLDKLVPGIYSIECNKVFNRKFIKY